MTVSANNNLTPNISNLNSQTATLQEKNDFSTLLNRDSNTATKLDAGYNLTEADITNILEAGKPENYDSKSFEDNKIAALPLAIGYIVGGLTVTDVAIGGAALGGSIVVKKAIDNSRTTFPSASQTETISGVNADASFGETDVKKGVFLDFLDAVFGDGVVEDDTVTTDDTTKKGKKANRSGKEVDHKEYKEGHNFGTSDVTNGKYLRDEESVKQQLNSEHAFNRGIGAAQKASNDKLIEDGIKNKDPKILNHLELQAKAKGR